MTLTIKAWEVAVGCERLRIRRLGRFEAAAFATGCDRLRPLGSISAPCFVVWSDDG
jgi:hypothetical protein